MNLLMPISFKNQPMILMLSPQFSYTDNLLQVTATVSMHIGFFFNLKDGEIASMKIPNITPTVQNQYSNYNKVRNFLNICANVGEAVDDSLLQLLEKAQPERKIEFAKMDFLKRRDQFSDLVKKNSEIKQLEEFNSSTSRKHITTTFSQFVKLRNYYTHGKLILKYESQQYYIQYIDKATGIKTASGIDRNILMSFIETGTELIRLINVISQAL